MIRALKSYLLSRRKARTALIAQQRQELVYAAYKGKPGAQVAQHKLEALTTMQLRLEVGR